MSWLQLLRLVTCCWLTFAAAWAQQGCPPAPVPSPSTANFLTTELETQFGRVLDDQFIQPKFNVLHDTTVNQYLDSVAGRLVAQLPPSGLKYRFFVLNMPAAEAFTLPGGRVYVTARMVAFLRNEDELAAVLGHELGHAVSHEPAEDASQMLHQGLGITTIANREDLLRQYNRLLDTYRTRNLSFNAHHSQQEQLTADQIAIYAMSRAGYAPQAFVTLFDRYAETHGKTGRWTDLFSGPNPGEQRLKAAERMLAEIPAACIAPHPSPAGTGFGMWQQAVIAAGSAAPEVSIPGLLTQQVLTPPLMPDVTAFRFSPDGKMIAAVDDSGVSVLQTQPLRFLFRVDEPEGLFDAHFTPKSTALVVLNPELRVERWDVVTKRREWVHEIAYQHGCEATSLSHHGTMLACVGFDNSLRVFDVTSGTELLEINSALRGFPNLNNFLRLSLLHFVIPVAFSPDDHYLLVARAPSALALDMTSRSEIKLSDDVRYLAGQGFIFLGDSKLVVANDTGGRSSGGLQIIQFPTGRPVAKLTAVGKVSPTVAVSGDGAELIVSTGTLTAVVDPVANKVLATAPKAALDYHDGLLVTENQAGEIGLLQAAGREVSLLGETTLLNPALAGLIASDISSDGKLLAISGRTRGAIWDVWTGQLKFRAPAYAGISFAADGAAYAFIPGHSRGGEPTVREFDLSSGAMKTAMTLDDKSNYEQAGEFLLQIQQDPRNRHKLRATTAWNAVAFRLAPEVAVVRDHTIAVRDVRSGSVLWTRTMKTYADPITAAGDGRAAFVWKTSDPEAKALLKRDKQLRDQISRARGQGEGFIIEVFDLRTGHGVGNLFISSNDLSLRVTDAISAGDRLLVQDDQDRMIAYSLTTAEEQGVVFGRMGPVSKKAGLFAVSNQMDQLVLYDLGSLQPRSRYQFDSPVRVVRFTADGSRMVVVTSDQEVYLIAVPRTGAELQQAS
jgi:hypothetical protein